VLSTQWISPSRARPTGWPALALAVLVDACRVAGFLPVHSPKPSARARADALAYLFGPPRDEALPLALACALVGGKPEQLRRQLTQRQSA
jgi:hypothetical protein